MKIKKLKILGLTLILSISLIGCGKEEKKVENPIRLVTVMDVKSGTHSNDITISGNVKPSQLIKQGFKLAGVIDSVHVKEGDKVSKGQTLVSLIPSDYELGVTAAQAQYNSLNMELNSKIESAVNQASANVEFIKTQLDRVRRLHEKGAVATKTVEELEVSLVVAENKYQEAIDARNTSVAQLKQAETALNLAQSQLGNTVLQSPIDGTVIKQISEVGETMAPGYPVLVLGRLDKLEVEVGVPDNLVDSIEINKSVKVFIHGINKEVEGVVSNIDTTADVETRTFGVKIDIDNPEGDIKPGMIANAIFPMNQITSIMVPIDSVIEDTKGTYILVYDSKGKKVERRAVKTGEIYKDKVQIIEGLKDGETIVYQGQYGIKNGEKVNIRREDND